jgi:methionyl-tRNA formyltransferase
MTKLKVLFMGRKNVAQRSLQWLLERDDVEVVGILTDSHIDNSPCAELSRAKGLPIYSYEEALDSINEGDLRFDLGLSMLYWRKLKDGFVHHPKLKTINFHPAPLPDYKGTAGYNMAILDGLSEWSMSAHYVDEEIDTGEIIELLSFPICKDTETVQSLEKTSQTKLYELFVSVVKKVLRDRKILPTSENVGGRYISRQEMEAMKEIKEGDDIPRKIRAFWFPPYHGAYIVINGQKYSLVDESILSSLSQEDISKVF